ncbi:MULTISPECIES: hypothetical protein [Streptomyces]|uniref:hypothetical protein n=1 Tax=Streptomyces lycopersici TaxID=2974589 RepID=UPI0021D341BB|nr:hypothetical protein [Streptomyces sp. NEAU-383]
MEFEIIKKRRGILAILPAQVIETTDDHEYACQRVTDLRRPLRGRRFAPHYYVRPSA